MDDLQVKNCSTSPSDYKLWFSSQALQENGFLCKWMGEEKSVLQQEKPTEKWNWGHITYTYTEIS